MRQPFRSFRSVPFWSFLAALVALPAGRVIAQSAAPETETYSELDGVDFGEQVWGERISRHDLEGRVVVCYHWCITCPLSTGAFPAVKQLCERFRDRGVVFIGFQVRRDPALRAENVVWALGQLQPNFPVTRRGWVCAWPVSYLPWAVVFDHEGRKIFADNLPGLEAAIRAALDQAPDPLVGGPYRQLSEPAATIAKGRGHAGRHMKALRDLAADEKADAAQRDEARAMLGCLERHYRRQIAKAEEDLPSPVAQAAVYRRLAMMFDGDPLGAQAKGRLEALEKEPRFGGEVKAHEALVRARAALRWLPPAGTYTYDMQYRPIRDPALRARRALRIAAFRLALDRLTKRYPRTQAASEAADLAVDHMIPELSAEEASEQLAEAERRLENAHTPCELYEAYLGIYAVDEGYYGDDAVAERTGERREALEIDRADALVRAAAVHDRLTGEAERIMDAVRAAGGVLAKADAREHRAGLLKVATEAGPGSRLAGEIGTFVTELEKSFAGPASLGIALDPRFEGTGARIYYVRPQSAAHRHGLQRGDVILKLGARAIESPTVLRDALGKLKPGQRVKLEIRRGGAEGETLALDVVLGRKV
jgi:hypothetical protein